MRRSRDFSSAVKQGQRIGSRRLVLHVVDTDSAEPTKVGLVVSRQVGNSVVRHRVARQLRAIANERVSSWPTGRLVVVRALPAAGGSPSSTLQTDLDNALSRVGTR